MTNLEHTSTSASQIDAADLDFVLNGFVEDTQGVLFAQTVSADGIHLAASEGSDTEQHDMFAAVASGLASLTDSTIDLFGLGELQRQIIEADQGWVLLGRVSLTATLGVVLERQADLGLVGYEMARLSKQLGEALSPDVVDRLKGMRAL